MIDQRKSYLINYDNYKGLIDRDIFRKVLVDIGKIDNEVVLLGVDSISSSGGNLFKEKFPDRVFDFGIAEQNMITAAAGFAILNKIPIASLYGFLIARVAEQIRNDICYNNLNVKIYSNTTSFDLPTAGVTHHGLEDISLMRSFPNITIIQPASPLEAILASYKAIFDFKGPIYLRLTRSMREEIYKKEDLKFEIGKANILKEGKDITFIATGRTVHLAKRTAEALEKEGVSIRLINMHTLKPIDEQVIIKAAKETKGIITIEDSNIVGGLGAATCQIVCKNAPTIVEMIGVSNDKFSVIAPSSQALWDYFGVTEENLIKITKKILSKKRLN